MRRASCVLSDPGVPTDPPGLFTSLLLFLPPTSRSRRLPHSAADATLSLRPRSITSAKEADDLLQEVEELTLDAKAVSAAKSPGGKKKSKKSKKMKAPGMAPPDMGPPPSMAPPSKSPEEDFMGDKEQSMHSAGMLDDEFDHDISSGPSSTSARADSKYVDDRDDGVDFMGGGDGTGLGSAGPLAPSAKSRARVLAQQRELQVCTTPLYCCFLLSLRHAP